MVCVYYLASELAKYTILSNCVRKFVIAIVVQAMGVEAMARIHDKGQFFRAAGPGFYTRKMSNSEPGRGHLRSRLVARLADPR